MRKTLFILLLSLACIVSVQCQVSVRKEIELSATSSSYFLKEKGFVLIEKPSESLRKIVHYDTAFKAQWETTVSIPMESDITDSRYQPSSSFLYFLTAQKKTKNTLHQLISLNLHDKKTEEKKLSCLEGVEIRVFFVNQDNLYFYGKNSKEKDVVGVCTISQNSLKISTIDTKGKVKGYFDDPEEGTISILFLQKEKSEQTVYLNKYSGNTLKESLKWTTPTTEKHILDAKIARMGKTVVLTGNYSNENDEGSEGFYTATFVDNIHQSTQYYDFIHDFKNFFAYMTEEEKKSHQEEVDKAAKKNKTYQTNLKVVLHPVITKDNQFIVIGESCVPLYSNEKTTVKRTVISSIRTTSPNDPKWVTEDREIERPVLWGYQTTHSTIVGFDATGKMIWDQFLEMNDVRQRYVAISLVKPIVSDNGVKLVYGTDSFFATKTVTASGTQKEKSYTPISEKNREEGMLYDANFAIFPWFANYFTVTEYKKNPESNIIIKKHLKIIRY